LRIVGFDYFICILSINLNTAHRHYYQVSFSRFDMVTDAELIECICDPILASDSLPKFGGGRGVSLADWVETRNNDPLYSIVGLNDPTIYTAHAGSSVMTSVYRQLGVGIERLFRLISVSKDWINCSNPDELKWTFVSSNGHNRELDLLIRRDMITDANKQRQLYEIASMMGEPPPIEEFRGIVFEIRQGYQSADSKRVAGDTEIVSRAREEGLLGVVVIASNSYNRGVIRNYRASGLPVLVPASGSEGNAGSCPYAFINDFLDYDLEAAFSRVGSTLRERILGHLHTRLGLNATEE